jgi:hypothetical protein
MIGPNDRLDSHTHITGPIRCQVCWSMRRSIAFLLILAFAASLHLQARWPSGLRRQLKVNPNTLVRKGVGSNPTLVNILLPVT